MTPEEEFKTFVDFCERKLARMEYEISTLKQQHQQLLRDFEQHKFEMHLA